MINKYSKTSQCNLGVELLSCLLANAAVSCSFLTCPIEYQRLQETLHNMNKPQGLFGNLNLGRHPELDNCTVPLVFSLICMYVCVDHCRPALSNNS